MFIFAPPGERAAVSFGYLLGDCQAQADAFGFAGNERLEKALCHFHRWTRSRINNVNLPSAICHLQTYLDPAAGSCRFNGVGNHVQKHMTKLIAVAEYDLFFLTGTRAMRLPA